MPNPQTQLAENFVDLEVSQKIFQGNNAQLNIKLFPGLAEVNKVAKPANLVGRKFSGSLGLTENSL